MNVKIDSFLLTFLHHIKAFIDFNFTFLFQLNLLDSPYSPTSLSPAKNNVSSRDSTNSISTKSTEYIWKSTAIVLTGVLIVVLIYIGRKKWFVCPFVIVISSNRRNSALILHIFYIEVHRGS